MTSIETVRPHDTVCDRRAGRSERRATIATFAARFVTQVIQHFLRLANGSLKGWRVLHRSLRRIPFRLTRPASPTASVCIAIL